MFDENSFKSTIVGYSIENLHSLQDQIEDNEAKLDLTTDQGQNTLKIYRLKLAIINTEITTRPTRRISNAGRRTTSIY
jgi:hypothetical protein